MSKTEILVELSKLALEARQVTEGGWFSIVLRGQPWPAKGPQ
jgi:hypothetical protein